MRFSSSKNIIKLIFNFTLILNSFAGDTPPSISLHAPLLDQAQSASGGGNPPMKISTGRMKPVTSPGSPRYEAAFAQTGVGSTKFLKGISHVAVSSAPDPQHLYPKISVRPGRKDSTVVSFFRHPESHPTGKPYEYMQHQKPDVLSDVHQPAKIYKVGYRKIDDQNSEDIHHAKIIQGHMAKGHYHPKAALVNTVPGDPRARRKGPTIDVDPGKLHGSILTHVYGPPASPKHGNPPYEHQGQPQASSGQGTSHDRARPHPSSPGGGGENKRQRVQ